MNSFCFPEFSMLYFLLQSVDSRGVVGSTDEKFTECPACSRGLCRSINGIYTRSNLPPGYSLIAQIPKGACRIIVQQLKHTRNFIGEYSCKICRYIQLFLRLYYWCILKQLELILLLHVIIHIRLNIWYEYLMNDIVFWNSWEIIDEDFYSNFFHRNLLNQEFSSVFL